MCRQVSPRPGYSPVPSLVRLCELMHRSVYLCHCSQASASVTLRTRQPKNSPEASPQSLFPYLATSSSCSDDQCPAIKVWKYSYQKPPNKHAQLKLNTSSSHRVYGPHLSLLYPEAVLCLSGTNIPALFPYPLPPISLPLHPSPV